MYWLQGWLQGWLLFFPQVQKFRGGNSWVKGGNSWVKGGKNRSWFWNTSDFRDAPYQKKQEGWLHVPLFMAFYAQSPCWFQGFVCSLIPLPWQPGVCLVPLSQESFHQKLWLRGCRWCRTVLGWIPWKGWMMMGAWLFVGVWYVMDMSLIWYW